MRYTAALMVTVLLLLAGGSACEAGFYCSFCQGQISGKYYEFSDGRILCNRCHTSLPRCDICDTPFNRGTRSGGQKVCAECLRTAERCRLCETIITGRYWKLPDSNEVFCNRCWQQAPRCQVCRSPLVDNAAGGADSLCAECLVRLPRCIHCSDPITDKYYRLDEGDLCGSCFDELPKCTVCGLPLVSAFRKVQRNRVCLSCHRQLPECNSCDSKIVGSCWQFEDNDGTYCNTCSKGKKKCNVCGLPLDRMSQVLADGRDLCSSCFKGGIFDMAVARGYLTRVKKLLRDELGIRVKTPARLSLVGRDAMGDLVRESPHLEKNNRDEYVGLFVRDGDDYHVYVEYGLTKSILIGTLAHEYTHVWQEANCPRDQSLLLREGFAEWVRFKICEKLGFEREIKRLNKRTDIYGKGFRLMRKMEKKRGVKRVFSFVKTATGVQESVSVRDAR